MDELSLHEIDARLKKAENDIVEIRQAIFGADGIQVKLAAIERGVQTQTWLLRAVAGAIITVLVKQFAG